MCSGRVCAALFSQSRRVDGVLIGRNMPDLAQRHTSTHSSKQSRRPIERQPATALRARVRLSERRNALSMAAPRANLTAT